MFKRIFIALIFILALASYAKADEVQTFDMGFREKSYNGYWFLSSERSLVFTCEGFFLSDIGHANSVRCPSPSYKLWMKILHQGTKFMERIQALAFLK